MALLATAYERPIEPYLLAKIWRACELCNEGDKALAHIHLAHAALLLCGDGEALRLFVAEELVENEVSPVALLKAQGFDAQRWISSNPGQPRIPKRNGRESGLRPPFVRKKDAATGAVA